MYGSKHEEIALNPVEYLNRRIKRSSKLLGRFPGPIDFNNKVILDVGCGFGPLSIFAARNGAREVVGVDPDPESIDTARSLISKNFPELQEQITFHCGTVEQLPIINADVAVSLAVFEHVDSPRNELQNLKRQLRIGGAIYLGIGPLYRSPWGDHGRLNAPLASIFPWAHLSFPKQWLLSRVKMTNGRAPVTTLQELGLNGFKYTQYIEAFEKSGLVLDWCETNCHELKGISSMLNAVARLPFIREFLTLNIYAILRKTDSE